MDAGQTFANPASESVDIVRPPTLYVIGGPIPVACRHPEDVNGLAVAGFSCFVRAETLGLDLWSRVSYAFRAEHTTGRPTFRVEWTPHAAPHCSTVKQHEGFGLRDGVIQLKE